MKRFVAPLLVFALLAAAVPQAAAQSQTRYESGLYLIVLAEHGPNWKPQSTDEGAKKKMQAIENIKKAIQQGNIISAGLVIDDVAADFVLIVEGEDENNLRRLLKEAPLVKEGFYKVRTLAWHAPKGLKLEPVPIEK